MASLMLAGCATNNGPKTTAGVGHGYGGEIKVELSTEAGKITGINVVSNHETSVVYDRALPILTERIIEAQSPVVDSVSGATFTSFGVKAAVAEAMKEAGMGEYKIDFTTQGPEVEKKDLEEVKTQVVVVGGGPAGLSAAIEAKQNGVEDVMFYQYDGAGFEQIETNGKVVILMSETELATSAEHVYVVDSDIFGTAGLAQKLDGETVKGLRITYTTGTDFAGWVDEKGISEFGVLMATEENAGSIKYIATTNANGIGKSVAFDDTHNDYLYAGGETEVAFSGTLIAEDDEGNDMSEELKHYDFAAAPYAVVDGKYTVIGDLTYFSYLGILE
jgi:hypothetical protein